MYTYYQIFQMYLEREREKELEARYLRNFYKKTRYMTSTPEMAKNMPNKLNPEFCPGEA